MPLFGLNKGQVSVGFENKCLARYATMHLKVKVENFTVNELWSCFFSNLNSFL